MRELGKDIDMHWFDAGHGTYATEQAIEHQQLRMEFTGKVLAARG